jgi:hypothetical protein
MNGCSSYRDMFINALLTHKGEAQLGEIRQMLIDILDVVGQTSNEEAVNEAFLAFEACRQHHGS